MDRKKVIITIIKCLRLDNLFGTTVNYFSEVIKKIKGKKNFNGIFFYKSKLITTKNLKSM